MATRIQLRRDTSANWASANTVLAQGEVGLNLTTGQIKIGDGTTAWNSLSYTSASVSLNDLGDVTITSAANGDFLRWNGTAWVNDAVNLSTDTVGDYVNTVTASTGVTITGSGGESASPVISIGQDVATAASVTFAQVTAPLVGNASTASQLQTARTISLTGDVSGSVSFSGSADASITATIQPNSVALGTDTTGNYVNDVVAGTGVTVSHTPGEGSSASIAIGQDVGTSASVQFGQVTTTGDVTVGGNLTVNGTTTTLNTETLAIEDNIVLLNSNVTGSPTTNAGIEVERGDSSNVVLRWNETTDSWEVTEDGSTYKNIAVGQDVETTSSVSFAVVTASTFTGNLVGNADTASALQTARTISLTGDVSGSVSFSGSADASITATIQPNSVALGTDTTGNYVNDVVAGTGVAVTHTPGEGSSASIAIGQDVGTSASVTFAQVTAPLVGNANTASTLETSRTISLAGDVTGSVAFNGSADVSITTTIQPNSVALGADTTGNYMADVYGGTGVTINHTAGEGSTASISIGQSVATSSSVTFAQVTASVVSVLSTPVNNSDAATKAYVDQVTAGINWHESVKYATAAALPNSPTYNVGSSDQNNGTGIGTTITAGTYGRLVIDGANASTGQRILVKNQPDAEHNGVYVVTEQGSASVYWILTRASDSDNSVAGQVKTGDAVYVVDGAVNANQGFIISSSGSEPNNVIRIGTDDITWTQFTGTAAFTAGNGLSTTGNTINIGTADSGRIVVNADTIDLASVAQTNTTGSDGISFIQSHSVDSYGRLTGVVTASVQNASTTQKGIAQFSASHFSVSSGSVQIASGGITTTEIANGTITNSDISESAGIGLLKLQSGTAGQIIVADASGVPSYVTPSGDVTVNASGVFSIAANSVALGTDTTGNYMTNIVGSGGIVVTHTPGEGSTASISIDPVNTSSNAGSDTTSFISSITVNSNGQVTAYNTSSVQDASTTQKGIARFNSNHFAVSSGSVSLATLSGDVTVDGSGVTAIGSGVIVNADINSAAAIDLSKLASGTSGQVVLANSSGVPTYTTISGDITISNTGVATIAANSVALGTDTTGNYMSDVTASTGVTISHTAGEGSTATIAIGQPVGTTDNVTFNNVTVGGNLTVNGTTTTVNSTTVTIDDPIFTLGGDSAPISDDNKDRGIEFRYHTGLSAALGFFGYDDSTGRFTFFTGATNTSEVFSGTNASVQVGSLHVVGGAGGQDYITANYDGATASISIAGTGDRMDLINSVSFRGLHFVSTGGTNSGSLSYSTATNTFSFSREITSASLSSALLTSASLSSASLSSASVVAPYISGSVQFDTSGSVTLPAKTFFPEEYLSVSSSVTLNSTTHRWATLEMTASAGTSVITVPADASDNFPVGSVIQIIRVGAGEVQVTASAGVTVNNALGSRLRAQWSTATLRKRSSNTWLLSGDLKV